MKKQILLYSVLLTSITSTAMAALPVYWDSVRRIEAAMNSKVSAELQGPITSVKSLGDLRYELSTDFCAATITLEAHVPNNPGATSYSLKSIDKLVCE
jgi:hypothetical protein